MEEGQERGAEDVARGDKKTVQRNAMALQSSTLRLGCTG
jgi:hypothetical protein